MYCRSLGIDPTVLLFRVFYKLCKQGNWFSFQSRGGKNFRPCLKEVKSSLKKWKYQFFLVDRRALPIAMPWRHLDSDVSDPAPPASTYNEDHVALLREVMVPVHKPHPNLLYAAGLSNMWKYAGHRCILKGPGGDGNAPLLNILCFTSNISCNFPFQLMSVLLGFFGSCHHVSASSISYFGGLQSFSRSSSCRW